MGVMRIVKIVIRFKSGFELPITCDKAEFSGNDLTGEITGYKFKGVKDNKPIFFRASDVECVYRVMEEENEE